MMRNMTRGEHATQHRDNLIAAIISLGTLDDRTGAKDTASMHFATVRRSLRSVGGPLKLRSPMLSTVMAYFECLYGTPTASCVWNAKDTGLLLEDFNSFLGKIWTLWNLLDKEDDGSDDSPGLRNAFALKSPSSLYEAFARPIQREHGEVPIKDTERLIFQLTCLLNLCLVVLDYCTVEGEELREYLDRLNESIEAAQLQRLPCNNHMWLIQAHDQSSEHNKRVWQGAGFTFLLKHTPYHLQLQVRDWLLAFMSGERTGEKKALKLNAFNFSYAQ